MTCKSPEPGTFWEGSEGLGRTFPQDGASGQGGGPGRAVLGSLGQGAARLEMGPQRPCSGGGKLGQWRAGGQAKSTDRRVWLRAVLGRRLSCVTL